MVLSKTADFSELKPQPDTKMNSRLVFSLNNPSLRGFYRGWNMLSKSDLDVKLIYSSGIDLDIVPSSSDKGQAMQFLHQKWNFVAERTVAYGDSGNNIALFAWRGGRMRYPCGKPSSGITTMA